MHIHLVNPSDVSFGTAVITPRWPYVLAAATPSEYGDPRITDETLEPFDPASVAQGDLVGIGIHTSNAHRGYQIGQLARARGASVVFGGIHATLYPEEARDHGAAHAVVKGDGDLIWPTVVRDCVREALQPIYEGGRVAGGAFLAARWDLLPRDRYMWGSVQTVRGCPKHCSFCSVWRTDGQQPRQRTAMDVVGEVVALRSLGFRFILLADDNFYPVTLGDLERARRRQDPEHLRSLTAIRAERFELLECLARLPGGLKSVYKDFNQAGEGLVTSLQAFRRHGVYVLGSFIFGLASDTPATFKATAELAQRAGVAFAQFVMLTPFPGTVDFAKWEATGPSASGTGGIPLTRYWLIPPDERPKVYLPHPALSPDELRRRTQATWDEFYGLGPIWRRSACVRSLHGRLAFVLISKLYRQMYANTGIATDSARITRAARWARWLARGVRRLFVTAPIPASKLVLR
jgi:radical SAM superfamily enzyme YgiQ (UPF0313 family)